MSDEFTEKKKGNPVRIPYFIRWGRHRTRILNGPFAYQMSR
jgi:hypothetical protein